MDLCFPLRSFCSALYEVFDPDLVGGTCRNFANVVGAPPRSRFVLALSSTSQVSVNVMATLSEYDGPSFIHVRCVLAILGKTQGLVIVHNWGITKATTAAREI